MYSEKTRIALVKADTIIAERGRSPRHTAVAGKPIGLTLAGIGLSNAIHRGFIDSAEHDADVQKEIAKIGGIKIEVR